MKNLIMVFNLEGESRILIYTDVTCYVISYKKIDT